MDQYLGVSARLLTHIGSLGDHLSDASRSAAGRPVGKKWDAVTDDLAISLNACPLLQSFWSTKCPPGIEEACLERLERSMRKSSSNASPIRIDRALSASTPGSTALSEPTEDPVSKWSEDFQAYLTKRVQESIKPDFTRWTQKINKPITWLPVPYSLPANVFLGLTSNLKAVYSLTTPLLFEGMAYPQGREINHIQQTCGELATLLNRTRPSHHPGVSKGDIWETRAILTSMSRREPISDLLPSQAY